ncbi:hypothetical protein J6590_027754 [Homalodisca vitripennis]|nr:hypothetical protein J6590_027754 [Homalodisca vitripennis]
MPRLYKNSGKCAVRTTWQFLELGTTNMPSVSGPHADLFQFCQDLLTKILFITRAGKTDLASAVRINRITTNPFLELHLRSWAKVGVKYSAIDLSGVDKKRSPGQRISFGSHSDRVIIAKIIANLFATTCQLDWAALRPRERFYRVPCEVLPANSAEDLHRNGQSQQHSYSCFYLPFLIWLRAARGNASPPGFSAFHCTRIPSVASHFVVFLGHRDCNGIF